MSDVPTPFPSTDSMTAISTPRSLVSLKLPRTRPVNRAFRISQEFIGGWHFGYAAPPGGLGLATALAASTAVPLIFPPVHLRAGGLGLKVAQRELSLLDGGVYDNLGLEWFQGWDRGRPEAARPCEFIIAVDASGPVKTVDRSFGWARSIKRSQDAQYAQSRMSRIRWFIDQLVDGRLKGIYVPIQYDPQRFRPPPDVKVIPDAADGALPPGFAGALSRLRTDLDRFSRTESELLVYHGYWTAHTRLRHLRPSLAVTSPQWREFADIDGATAASLMTQLADGADFRAFRR